MSSAARRWIRRAALVVALLVPGAAAFAGASGFDVRVPRAADNAAKDALFARAAGEAATRLARPGTPAYEAILDRYLEGYAKIRAGAIADTSARRAVEDLLRGADPTIDVTSRHFGSKPGTRFDGGRWSDADVALTPEEYGRVVRKLGERVTVEVGLHSSYVPSADLKLLPTGNPNVPRGWSASDMWDRVRDLENVPNYVSPRVSDSLKKMSPYLGNLPAGMAELEERLTHVGKEVSKMCDAARAAPGRPVGTLTTADEAIMARLRAREPVLFGRNGIASITDTPEQVREKVEAFLRDKVQPYVTKSLKADIAATEASLAAARKAADEAARALEAAKAAGKGVAGAQEDLRAARQRAADVEKILEVDRMNLRIASRQSGLAAEIAGLPRVPTAAGIVRDAAGSAREWFASRPGELRSSLALFATMELAKVYMEGRTVPTLGDVGSVGKEAILWTLRGRQTADAVTGLKRWSHDWVEESMTRAIAEWESKGGSRWDVDFLVRNVPFHILVGTVFGAWEGARAIPGADRFVYLGDLVGFGWSKLRGEDLVQRAAGEEAVTLGELAQVADAVAGQYPAIAASAREAADALRRRREAGEAALLLVEQARGNWRLLDDEVRAAAERPPPPPRDLVVPDDAAVAGLVARCEATREAADRTTASAEALLAEIRAGLDARTARARCFALRDGFAPVRDERDALARAIEPLGAAAPRAAAWTGDGDLARRLADARETYARAVRDAAAVRAGLDADERNYARAHDLWIHARRMIEKAATILDRGVVGRIPIELVAKLRDARRAVDASGLEVADDGRALARDLDGVALVAERDLAQPPPDAPGGATAGDESDVARARAIVAAWRRLETPFTAMLAAVARAERALAALGDVAAPPPFEILRVRVNGPPARPEGASVRPGDRIEVLVDVRVRGAVPAGSTMTLGISGPNGPLAEPWPQPIEEVADARRPEGAVQSWTRRQALPDDLPEGTYEALVTVTAGGAEGAGTEGGGGGEGTVRRRTTFDVRWPVRFVRLAAFDDARPPAPCSTFGPGAGFAWEGAVARMSADPDEEVRLGFELTANDSPAPWGGLAPRRTGAEPAMRHEGLVPDDAAAGPYRLVLVADVGGVTYRSRPLDLTVGLLPTVTITEPSAGFTTTEKVLVVRGTCADPSLTQAQLTTNGATSTIRLSSGRFEAKTVLRPGENRIVVTAQNASGTRSAEVAGTADIKAAVLKIVLSWEVVGVDVDLWVVDPEGQRTNYHRKRPADGRSLDIDDTQGPGTETYTMELPVTGTYRVEVHYFRGEGAVPFRLDVTTWEGTPREGRASSTGTLTKAANDAYKPGAVVSTTVPVP